MDESWNLGIGNRGAGILLLQLGIIIMIGIPFLAYMKYSSGSGEQEALVDLWKDAFKVADSMHSLLGSPAEADCVEVAFQAEEWTFEIDTSEKRLRLYSPEAKMGKSPAERPDKWDVAVLGTPGKEVWVGSCDDGADDHEKFDIYAGYGKDIDNYDFNGDGIDDLVVLGRKPPGDNVGSVTVFDLQAWEESGFEHDISQVIVPWATFDVYDEMTQKGIEEYGFKKVIAGDFDGEGVPEIFIAPLLDIKGDDGIGIYDKMSGWRVVRAGFCPADVEGCTEGEPVEVTVKYSAAGDHDGDGADELFALNYFSHEEYMDIEEYPWYTKFRTDWPSLNDVPTAVVFDLQNGETFIDIYLDSKEIIPIVLEKAAAEADSETRKNADGYVCSDIALGDFAGDGGIGFAALCQAYKGSAYWIGVVVYTYDPDDETWSKYAVDHLKRPAEDYNLVMEISAGEYDESYVGDEIAFLYKDNDGVCWLKILNVKDGNIVQATGGGCDAEVCESPDIYFPKLARMGIGEASGWRSGTAEVGLFTSSDDLFRDTVMDSTECSDSSSAMLKISKDGSRLDTCLLCPGCSGTACCQEGCEA